MVYDALSVYEAWAFPSRDVYVFYIYNQPMLFLRNKREKKIQNENWK